MVLLLLLLVVCLVPYCLCIAVYVCRQVDIQAKLKLSMLFYLEEAYFQLLLAVMKF